MNISYVYSLQLYKYWNTGGLYSFLESYKVWNEGTDTGLSINNDSSNFSWEKAYYCFMNRHNGPANAVQNDVAAMLAVII